MIEKNNENNKDDKDTKTKSSNLFMKCIIIFCLIYVVAITEQGLYICYIHGDSVTTIVCTSITAFVTELILCVLKRIFTKEDKQDGIVNNDNDEENFQSINM